MVTIGIDIYLEWDGMTEKEKQAQSTGFSTVHGHVGYLREAYHGEPYATQYLVKEAFEKKGGKAEISAKLLQDRLKETLKLVEIREKNIYKAKPKEIEAVKKSYKDFVKLCVMKQNLKTGKIRVIASY